MTRSVSLSWRRSTWRARVRAWVTWSEAPVCTVPWSWPGVVSGGVGGVAALTGKEDEGKGAVALDELVDGLLE